MYYEDGVSVLFSHPAAKFHVTVEYASTLVGTLCFSFCCTCQFAYPATAERKLWLLATLKFTSVFFFLTTYAIYYHIGICKQLLDDMTLRFLRRSIRDNLDTRGGILNPLPAPLPSIVGASDIPVVGPILSGGTKSSSPHDPIASVVGDIPVVGPIVSALPSAASSVASVVDKVPVVGPVISALPSAVVDGIPVVSPIVSAATKSLPSIVDPIISAVTKPLPPSLASIASPIFSEVTKFLPSPSSSPRPPLSSAPSPLSSPSPSLSSLSPPLSSPHPPLSSLSPPPSSLSPPLSSPFPPLPSLSPPLSSIPPPLSSLAHPLSSLAHPVSPLHPHSPSLGNGLSSTSAPSTPTQHGSLGIPQPSSGTVNGGSNLTPAALSTSIASGNNLNFTSTSVSGNESPAPDVVNIANTASILGPDTMQNGVISGSASSSNPSSSGGPNGTGTNNGNPSALANSHHQLSSGEIAAIITVVLLVFIVLPIIIFILRRRFKRRRDERKAQWWFATSTRPLQPYGDVANMQLLPAGTQTARSSFATTVDHSELIRPTHVIPPLPPVTTEIGRGNASRPGLVINTFNEKNDNNSEEPRYSIASAGSDRSQYLIVHHRNSANLDPLVNTPMSVRPFSPFESFAFPKPPEPTGSGRASVVGASKHTRSLTSITSATFPPPGLPSLPTFKPLIVPHTIKPLNPTPDPVDPFTDNNPFDDPTTPMIEDSEYSDVRVVCRPHVPTLPDELNMVMDESVRVLHIFDDGWGLVEKVERDGGEGEMGLIPMDCLRNPEEGFGPGNGADGGEGPLVF